VIPVDPRTGRMPPAVIAVTLALLAPVWIGTVLLNRQLGDHLGSELYMPACRNACAPVKARPHSFRLGGRGNRGKVDCWCNGPAVSDWRWVRADLSKGALSDRLLHWGGDTAITLGFFVVFSLIALAAGHAIGARLGRKRG
jgi:hypothetical protein